MFSFHYYPHLKISIKRIWKFGENAGKKFSNSLFDIKNMLELLDLSGNCLSNIPAQNLRNCIQLMYLDLSDNAIKEIANFQLMNLPLLKVSFLI